MMFWILARYVHCIWGNKSIGENFFDDGKDLVQETYQKDLSEPLNLRESIWDVIYKQGLLRRFRDPHSGP